MSEPQQRRPLAVALEYDKDKVGSAPRVTAIGRDWLGEKIIATAREHNVPLEENPALAEALSTVELDSEIPPELYKAVAEIIGFILRASAPRRPQPPVPSPAAPDQADDSREDQPLP